MRYKNNIPVLLLVIIFTLAACNRQSNNMHAVSVENDISNPTPTAGITNAQKEHDNTPLITEVIGELVEKDNSISHITNPTPEQKEEIELGHQKSNKVIYVDLDGDGNSEKIKYTSSGKLFINDIEYDDHIKRFGSKEKPLSDYFTLLDIDSTDNYIEIGISTYGRSDDLYTLFYYFDKERLIFMGEIGGIPYNQGESITVGKDGVLKAPKGFSILHSGWGGDAYFDLSDEHELIFREQDFWVTRCWNPVNLLQPLKLYTEPDKNSDTFIIPIQPVTFTMTDDKNWVKLKGEDGSEGWFYISSSYMEDGITLITDVFEGLMFYD